jgi:hypothetical protein
MAQPHRKDYYRHLVKFMSFRDGINYGNDAHFTPLQLDAITPAELGQYFCINYLLVGEFTFLFISNFFQLCPPPA